MQSKTHVKTSVILIVIIFLGLWAVRLMPVTAQTGNGTDEDTGQELPPEQRQALLEQMSRAAAGAQTSTNSDCTIGSWQTVSPVNTARSRPALTYASFNGRFYMLGGEGTGSNYALPIEEYDPATDTWTDKANMLTGVSNTGAAAMGQYIYVPGGYNSGIGGLDTMQRYNIVADTLTTLAPMTSTLFANAVVGLNNKVHVLGGSATGTTGNTHRIYDIATNSWQTGAPLPVPVHYAAAVTNGPYIYVLGGTTSDLPTVQRYNPISDAWTLIPDMGTGRGGVAGFFDGKNVWAVGGGWSTYLATTEFWDGISWQAGPPMNVGVRTTGAAFGDGLALKAAGWNGGYEDDAEILPVACPPPPPPPDCTFGDWQAVNPINTPRSRPSLTYAANNGRFYLLGGEASGGNRDIPIEEYNPVSGTWADKSLLLTGVSNIGAAAVGNYIYVPGGWTGALGIADLQRYDIQSDTVVTMTLMPAGNFAHAVVAHKNKLYVLGGSSTGDPGFTNYVYDIATDSWSNGAPLITAVQYPAAASDGKYIYVMGGNTNNLISVQRYDPAADVWAEAPIMDTGRGGAGAFFDGFNVWAVGGGWASYLNSTEYFDGYQWRLGPNLNVGVRTVGATFGAGLALKAGGWNGAYADSAETLEISCQRYLFLPSVLKD